MMMMMMMMMMITIVFKGAIWDYFYNLLTAPRTVSNTHPQVARAQSCANHVQRIDRLWRATCRVRATWYEETAQLLSLTEWKSHLLELYLIGSAIKSVKARRKRKYPQKTPGDELQNTWPSQFQIPDGFSSHAPLRVCEVKLLVWDKHQVPSVIHLRDNSSLAAVTFKAVTVWIQIC